MLEHIAVICRSLNPGGAVGHVALRQAAELARYANVTLLSDHFSQTPAPDLARRPLRPMQFGMLRRFGHVPNEVAFALAAKRALGRLHEDQRVDFVICHAHSVAAISAVPLQRRLGIPYALVTHGDIFDRPKGTYDARLTWLYRRTTPVAYRRADLVVALSPHMARLAADRGAGSGRISLIPNGIDPRDIGLDGGLAAPAFVASAPASDRLEALYVGRLAVEKGVDVLLNAAALLKRDGIALRLRIAGAGPEEQALREQAAALKLDDSVVFLGAVPRQSLGALYRSAAVVCVPSRSDPLPGVVLEAMCAGVAVIGADRGGIPYMVQDRITGLVCPAEHAAALAGALTCIGRDPALAQQMGRAGYARAREEFTWSNTGDRLARAMTHRLAEAAGG